jgi:hypothetical protein
MRVIGRGDDHRVDVPVVEHAAEVVLRLRAGRHGESLGEIRLVDVAHRGDIGIGLLHGVAEIALALPPRPDQRDDDAVVRAANALVTSPAEWLNTDAAGDNAGRAPIHQLATSEVGVL